MTQLKNFRRIALICLVVGLSNCAGTISGVIAGPTMGGISLTERLVDSNASPAVTLFGSPFAFIAGTLCGIFPAVDRGWDFDGYFTSDSDEVRMVSYESIFDPFRSDVIDNR